MYECTAIKEYANRYAMETQLGTRHVTINFARLRKHSPLFECSVVHGLLSSSLARLSVIVVLAMYRAVA